MTLARLLDTAPPRLLTEAAHGSLKPPLQGGSEGPSFIAGEELPPLLDMVPSFEGQRDFPP
jgi:hypothetical protein